MKDADRLIRQEYQDKKPVAKTGDQNIEEDLQKQQLKLRAEVEFDEKVRYAETPAEIELARQLYSYMYLLGQEEAHCRRFPLYYDYDKEAGQYHCLLCRKMVAQQHLNSERHRHRLENNTEYGFGHDRCVPLPRAPADRQAHREEEQAPQIPPSRHPALWKKAILEEEPYQ